MVSLSQDDDIEDAKSSSPAMRASPVLRSTKRKFENDGNDAAKESAVRRRNMARTDSTHDKKQTLESRRDSRIPLPTKGEEDQTRDGGEEDDGQSTSEMSKEMVESTAIHRRFASEEMEVDGSFGSTGPAVVDEAEEPKDEGDSENDAPESVTIAAGFKASRAAAAEATRIAKM